MLPYLYKLEILHEWFYSLVEKDQVVHLQSCALDSLCLSYSDPPLYPILPHWRGKVKAHFADEES